MSRTARITTGAVLAGVLAFVALVAAVVAGFSAAVGGTWEAAGADEVAVAEVLDVDDDLGWATVDVRYTTTEGEVVVSWVDWEHREQLPVVGDTVEVVYDPLDPEWVFSSDDPAVTGEDGAAGPAAEVSDGGAVARTAGWVALAALGGLVLTAVVTLVAALAAPARPREQHLTPFAATVTQGPPPGDGSRQGGTPYARSGTPDPYLVPGGEGPVAGTPAARGWSSPG